MSELWLVVSIGHCATVWLSRVLDERPNIRAYHELKTERTGISWEKNLPYEEEHGPHGGRFAGYWRQLEQDKEDYEVIADINSWVPTNAPIEDADRLVYIVRHGVSQTNSYSRGGVWSKAPRYGFALDDYARKYWELAGRPLKHWSKWSRWERICGVWNANWLMPAKWDEIEVYRMEELTRGLALKNIVSDITVKEMVRWQKRDINRHVSGSHDPKDIWKQWTREKREAFMNVCGEGMEELGYEIPEGANV